MERAREDGKGQGEQVARQEGNRMERKKEGRWDSITLGSLLMRSFQLSEKLGLFVQCEGRDEKENVEEVGKGGGGGRGKRVGVGRRRRTRRRG